MQQKLLLVFCQMSSKSLVNTSRKEKIKKGGGDDQLFSVVGSLPLLFTLFLVSDYFVITLLVRRFFSPLESLYIYNY